ncbi:2-aminobenzoate-CoA ligase [Murinocardiopsis flavida]|uniref:2-aminobenzoate-CoA ligase n=1 Tax=Murinocardiopsis flavida TaxID=645275 RepID=A0A2P8DSR6_9ACTN|nr:AMP-binding protein [Murinocardiopsis flavida]PSL00269.1 2-aminobenzoate-CoA ligase [Murinocardiopsis flavida]
MQQSLSPSAHEDTFARDHLPPAEQWPKIRFDLPELAYPDRLNCAAELLDATIARFGADRLCVRGEDESWTYGELRGRVDAAARVLVEEYGVRPGNRVLLRGPNAPWLAVYWLAILKAGGVVVTVLPMLRSGELATILRAARVSHAVCEVRSAADLETAADATAADLGARTVIARYGGGEPGDLVHRAAASPGAFAAVATAADDVALIAFTSGTTGRPKGCMHFHRDVLAIADTFSAHVLRPEPDDVFAGSPPFAFTFGLGGLLIFPMRAGAATLLLEKAGPERLARAIDADGATVVFTAPTAYRAMLAHAGTHDLARARRCVSAGEHLPARVWRAWFDATGVRIIDGIGATEMLHIFVSAADDAIRPGATGVAVPGFTADVLAADGSPMPDGEPGLLAVRGPVGCRYLADDRQRDYVRHGWNITGDTYVRDADGYLWYRSRSDDMIISAGYNIAAMEVEEVLARAPEVEEVAVVGVADEDRGQIVKAFVVLTDGTEQSDATAQHLKDFVKAEVAPYKTPRAVEFLAALPRTETGKLQRYKLRETG